MASSKMRRRTYLSGISGGAASEGPARHSGKRRATPPAPPPPPRTRRWPRSPPTCSAGRCCARACSSGCERKRQSAKMSGSTPLFPKEESAATSRPPGEFAMVRGPMMRDTMASARPTWSQAASGSGSTVSAAAAAEAVAVVRRAQSAGSRHPLLPAAVDVGARLAQQADAGGAAVQRGH